MFVEEKRQGESQVQAPSMEGFIAWLRTQDPKERFDFTSFGECPCACYSYSLGWPRGKWSSSGSFNNIHSRIATFMHWGRNRPTYGKLLDYMVRHEQA